MAKAELPDLVLMDVVMPGVNGFQATANYQASHHQPYPGDYRDHRDQETDRIWAARQGAKGYVLKPVDEDTLIETINKFLPKK